MHKRTIKKNPPFCIAQRTNIVCEDEKGFVEAIL